MEIVNKKELASLINHYCNLLLPGFKHDNWEAAAFTLKQISKSVNIETYSLLGSLLSEMYSEPSTQLISEVKQQVFEELNIRS